MMFTIRHGTLFASEVRVQSTNVFHSGLNHEMPTKTETTPSFKPRNGRENDCQCILQKSVLPKTEGEKVANVFIFLGFLRVPYKTVCDCWKPNQRRQNGMAMGSGRSGWRVGGRATCTAVHYDRSYPPRGARGMTWLPIYDRLWGFSAAPAVGY